MSHSSVRDTIMAAKLKEGLQDCVVYLRMLEGAKLPGVYERKRKQLMERLLDLQDDTRRDQPPKFDEDTESLTSMGSPQKKSVTEDEEEPSTPGTDGPNKRASKVMSSVSKFEVKPAASKFKYRTLEELKELKRRRESGLPEESEPPAEKADEKVQDKAETESKEVDVETKKVDSNSLQEESEDLYDDTVNLQVSAQQQEEEVKHEAEGTKKERSNTKGTRLMKRLFKKDKTNKGHVAESASMDNLSVEDQESDAISATKVDAAVSEEVAAPEEEEGEEGFHLVSQLEKVTKGRFGKFHYQNYKAELAGDQVVLSRPKDKEPTVISLVGAATAVRDPYQFELHTEDKSFTFRTDSEDLTVKWVETLKAAIDACTPVEPIEEETDEEEESSAPQITVDDIDETPSQTNKDIKESASDYVNYVFGKKKKLEMPDLNTVIIRGFLYRKATFGWDRVWVCLTEENTLFLAANDATKKVLQSLQVTEGVKIEPKKGSDKYPHCMLITGGKFKEALATDVKMEFDTWRLCLEQAAGGGAEIQELLSEDEDGELYEPLEDNPRPYLPSSPRPSLPPPAVSSSPRPSIPPPTTSSAADEDMYEVGDDIYEGLEDMDLPATPQVPRPTPVVNKSPSLPPRNEPTPSLPPRNEPTPSLPPRNEPYKKDTALPPRPPKATPTAPEPGDDIYDDVVGGAAMEETYDDVVQSGGIEEETYDDVTTATNITGQDDGGELYEEMEQQQGYVAMERMEKNEPEEYLEMDTGRDEAVDDEFYVEVDEPPPRPPPPSAQFSTPAAITKPSPPLQPQKSASTSSTPPATPKSISSINRTRASSSNKVAALSKMFGQPDASSSSSKPTKKGTHSGSLLYKSPAKKAFASEWCVLENSVMIFYSSPTDKLNHYRLNLKDTTLKLGTPEGQGSKFSFYITKATNHHQFSATTLQEMAEWIQHCTKVLQVSPSYEHLYKALQDYSSTKDGHISFKKGAVMWVLGHETTTLWMGVVGTSSQDFTDTTGLFPSNMVEPFGQEDVYI